MVRRTLFNIFLALRTEVSSLSAISFISRFSRNKRVTTSSALKFRIPKLLSDVSAPMYIMIDYLNLSKWA